MMRINGTSTFKGEDLTELPWAIISITAPIITILQALLVFLVLKYRGWNKYLYPLLLMVFYMRFLAALMNLVHVNDEGRVNAFQGIAVLSIIVSVLLFYMVYDISKKYKLIGEFQLVTVLIIMVESSFLIFSYPFLEIREYLMSNI